MTSRTSLASLRFSPIRRARGCRALMDSARRPAGELAYAANISAQSASAHPGQIGGRRIAGVGSAGSAPLLPDRERRSSGCDRNLASLSVAVAPRARKPLPSKSVPIQFLYSRTCYDHLAGETAVQVCVAMLKARWLTRKGDSASPPREDGWRRSISISPPCASRGVFARACVDLTQRRPHIEGATGAALLGLYVARGWILRARARASSPSRPGPGGVPAGVRAHRL